LVSDGPGYCALLTSGTVDCWGDNTLGQLGNGTISGPDSCSSFPCDPTPGPVSGVSSATSLTSDGGGYCAVLTSGAVDCWGNNDVGDLGNGTTAGIYCFGHSCDPTPGPVSGVTTAASLAGDGGDYTYFSGGYCARLVSGAIDCWGNNSTGELGNGTLTGPFACNSSVCDPIPGPVSGVSSASSLISDGAGYCARLASGAVDCWGANTTGELGNGTVTGLSCFGYACEPTRGPVSGVSTAASLASDGFLGGGYCAVLTSGTVDCWGNNQFGQLGDGTTGSPDASPGPASGILP
jgi:alpha-tubulin suppressor-like RCC1 family protein